MARTGEGRARAKAAGTHIGRPRKLLPFRRQEAPQRREAGETLTDIAPYIHTAWRTRRWRGFGWAIPPAALGTTLSFCHVQVLRRSHHQQISRAGT
jgi:hypothetical protein